VPVLKSFAGGRLFGGIWGDGPATIVALHGWRRTHVDFDPVFDSREAAGQRVVALDLNGFGATPEPPEPWGSEDYADALVDLFDEPGALAEKVVVVGHSFGGRVAVRLATKVPDRIERLVLSGVPLLDREGRRARPAAAYRLVRRLHGVGLVGDHRLEAMKDKYGSPDYRAAKGVMRDVFVKLLAESYSADMAAIGCPVDLVWGAADTEVPLEVATRASGIFPAARLIVLPEIGHLVPTEAPGALWEVIVGDRADPGTGGGRP
jgi:pimeloyl-ACP methyl ester carboxylesterase